MVIAIGAFLYFSHMEKITFWEIIEKSQLVPQEDQYHELEKLLSKYTLNDIVDFEIILRELIIELDDYKVMGVLKIIEGYVSDDPYLYFRCWVIGRGKKVFDLALQHPDDLAGLVDPSTIPGFEELLYVADDAYESKNGDGEDLPRDIAAGKGLSYDFGAPDTKGTDWEEDDLPRLYPKLWAIFN